MPILSSISSLRSLPFVRVDLPVLKIILAVMLTDLAHHPAGISDSDHIGRNIFGHDAPRTDHHIVTDRSEEHTSELQSQR